MSEFEKNNDSIIEAWEQVERITVTRVMPSSKDALLRFIEAPLRDAVEIFYDKNIQTIGSSCNELDFYKGFAWISLDLESLSSRNREIADEYQFVKHTEIHGTKIAIVGLFFPISEQESPQDISRYASELATQFEWQPFTWAPHWDIDEARRAFTIKDEDLLSCSDDKLIELLSQDDYYFDPVSKVLYMSEEHFQKTSQLQQS